LKWLPERQLMNSPHPSLRQVMSEPNYSQLYRGGLYFENQCWVWSISFKKRALQRNCQGYKVNSWPSLPTPMYAVLERHMDCVCGGFLYFYVLISADLLPTDDCSMKLAKYSRAPSRELVDRFYIRSWDTPIDRGYIIAIRIDRPWVHRLKQWNRFPRNLASVQAFFSLFGGVWVPNETVKGWGFVPPLCFRMMLLLLTRAGPSWKTDSHIEGEGGLQIDHLRLGVVTGQTLLNSWFDMYYHEQRC
jgi:hypothetical protein